LISSELAGEDFSEMTSESAREKKRKPGRPREIDPESLRRAVNELQFVLEQNWGEVGLGLWGAKTTADVRAAIRKIKNYRSGLLDQFTKDNTRSMSAPELRENRRNLNFAEQRHRVEYAEYLKVSERYERASAAYKCEHDFVKKEELRKILVSLESDHLKEKALESETRSDLEALKKRREEGEAYFAQSEILKFLQSNRRSFTPMNLACAMAGLPGVTARHSCDLCRKYGIRPPAGMAYSQFKFIENSLKGIMQDRFMGVDKVKRELLKASNEGLAHIIELKKNWYFLARAIREAGEVQSNNDLLAFRVFSRYISLSCLHSAADSVLAEAEKL
jgi:hypothetical protein